MKWTDAEVEKALEMKRWHHTYREIGEVLNRPGYGVAAKIQRMEKQEKTLTEDDWEIVIYALGHVVAKGGRIGQEADEVLDKLEDQ